MRIIRLHGITTVIARLVWHSPIQDVAVMAIASRQRNSVNGSAANTRELVSCSYKLILFDG